MTRKEVIELLRETMDDAWAKAKPDWSTFLTVAAEAILNLIRQNGWVELAEDQNVPTILPGRGYIMRADWCAGYICAVMDMITPKDGTVWMKVKVKTVQEKK